MNKDQMKRLVLDKIRRECLRLKDQDVAENTTNGREDKGRQKDAFFSRVYEYFQNKSTIKKAYLDMMLAESFPVSCMWELYRKSVWLGCDTWSEMDEILEDMYCYRKACIAA